MSKVEQNYQNLLSAIKSLQSENEVDVLPTIIAVSKTRTLKEIDEAYKCGLRNFGENYLQEAVSKINSCQHSLTWHFIGSIQSNKTKQIAQYFQWVHTITRFKIAQKISQHREEPMNVCLQVKLQNDDPRDSVVFDDLPALAEKVKDLKNIRLRGLMGMTSGELRVNERSKYFKKLTEAFDNLNHQGFNLDTISMGMSEDYDLAVQNRSNMIRIGTALFGKRST